MNLIQAKDLSRIIKIYEEYINSEVVIKRSRGCKGIKIIIAEIKSEDSFLTCPYEIEDGDHDREEEVWIREEWDLRGNYFIMSITQGHGICQNYLTYNDKS